MAAPGHPSATAPALPYLLHPCSRGLRGTGASCTMAALRPTGFVARKARSYMFADPALAESELGRKAALDMQAMCSDSWRWQQKNPRGY